jgi:hypothetical protein
MVAADLVFGASVGRPNIEALARETSALRIDAERNPDEAARARQCARKERSGDVDLDRAIVEIQARNKREGVLVGATIRTCQADLQSIAVAVAHGFHGHIARPDL